MNFINFFLRNLRGEKKKKEKRGKKKEETKLSQYTRNSLLIISEIPTWWIIWALGVVIM